MKHNTGEEQNRAFSELSSSRGHAQQGMALATPAPGLWGQVFVTSTASVGTPKPRYPHLSSRNNAHYTLAKWDEKTKG
jgi:hypothetical protein